MHKKKTPGLSGKEAADHVPSWAQGERPLTTENGRDFAKRLLDDKYGAGNYPTGPGSAFNKINEVGRPGVRVTSGRRTMASVFVVQHVHSWEGGVEDVK